MSFRCFGVLIAAYVLSTAILAAVVYWQTSEVDGVHFAIDTMTLRGRIGDPPNDKIKNPCLFKVAEDVAALLVFVILGFGLTFHVTMIEAVVARRQFDREKVVKGPAKPKSWQEWLKERDPAMYEEYYGTSENWWLRFKRWLMNFPR